MDNQIEQLKSANNYNEDWAILPYDQIEDGQRWIKLIEEIDELRERADRFKRESKQLNDARPEIEENQLPSDSQFSENDLF